MKSKKLSILFAALALILATLACSFGEMSLDNPRMSTDDEGKNVVTSYSPDATFIVVSDLKNGTKGTKLEPKWYAVNVEGVDAGPIEVEGDSSITIEDDYFSGYIYFQLSSDEPWAVGEYKVELYMNGTLVHTINFTVK